MGSVIACGFYTPDYRLPEWRPPCASRPLGPALGVAPQMCPASDHQRWPPNRGWTKTGRQLQAGHGVAMSRSRRSSDAAADAPHSCLVGELRPACSKRAPVALTPLIIR